MGAAIFIDLFFYQVNVWMITISVLNACKILILLTLAFGKDLGEKKTLAIFYMLLTADGIKMVLAIVNMLSIGFDLSFAGYVTALICDGTIGLAIRGKYENKKTLWQGIKFENDSQCRKKLKISKNRYINLK
ncbi:MAG: hypothetical protein K5883_07320 [Pseudobutyrivibrio sp.]|nr:hypothetical protein [Pseudobutyrivibrio sp.]